MKAEIITGILKITPESNTEDFALEQWFDNHKNGCSFIMKPLDLRKDINFDSYKKNQYPYMSIKEFFYLRILKRFSKCPEKKNGIKNIQIFDVGKK